MADNDGEVKIGVNLDTEDVAKNIDGLKGKLTKLTGSNVLKSITGLGAAFLTVSTAVKTANKVIKETSEAYRVQAKAEKQLEAAAKNNPYLDGKSVRQLKNFASELQSISTTGDEVLIPLMAQLASAGRTQAEIQNIMSAALDVSASGMMSLESAVQSLNASYSGNIGQLGRQIGELKNLTAEELKNGAAVDIVKNKFAGMSKEVAEATGTSEQLKNAWGDLKEEIGAPFEKGLKPLRKFFTELINGWTDAKKAKREYEEASEKENKDAADYNYLIEEEIKKQKAAQDIVNDLIERLKDRKKLAEEAAENNLDYDLYLAGLKQDLLLNQSIYEEKTSLIAVYKEELKLAEESEAAAKKDAATKAAAAAAAKEEQERQQAKAEFLKANQEALDLEIEKIRQEAKARGEAVDEQAILNAYVQSYVDLVTSGIVDENDPFSKNRLKQLQDYAKAIKDTDGNYKELLETIKEFLGDVSGENKLSETINATIESLKNERDALNKTGDAWKAYNEKIIELEKLKGEVVAKEEEQTKQKALETAESFIDSMSGYITKFTSVLSDLTAIASKNNKQQTDEELTNLSEQYTDGLISYEEYCKKKGEINKKAALEEYKINLYNWQISLLNAAANIASGVVSALAEPGIPTWLKFVNMGLIAASGTAQVAALAASKPQRPAFKGGGFVSGMHGASVGNDTVTANLRPGELVLNAAQQAQLWAAANGGGGGGMSINVDVINNMGDSAKVNTQLTAQGLRVTIDRLVKASISEGRYNSSLDTANNMRTGVNYL